jgi:hypothetical protein
MLAEAFNGKAEYTVLKADKYKFITRQQIGDRDIVFLGDITTDGDADIEFAEVAKDTPIKDYSKKGTYALTGSGDEIKVFAMVAKSIKEMVSRYEPTKINFSAEKDGNGRRPSVYERMLKKSLPDYEITKYDSKVTGKHGAVLFTLYKK